jgi:predicted phosphate transport protein (TIGR00153 family)
MLPSAALPATDTTPSAFLPHERSPRLFSLLPKADVFFDLFEKAAANAHECTLALVELLERFDHIEARVRRVKELEHIGDELTHELIDRLNQTFITPLDREDIHELACRIDDILDRVDTAVDRIFLFKVEKPLPESLELARCLVRSTALIGEMMPSLRKMGKPEDVRLKVREVHRLESEADAIERQALTRLFEGNPDPIHVIKWKNIIEVLESATDKCEDVANVIEGIVLKNA